MIRPYWQLETEPDPPVCTLPGFIVGAGIAVVVIVAAALCGLVA